MDLELETMSRIRNELEVALHEERAKQRETEQLISDLQIERDRLSQNVENEKEQSLRLKDLVKSTESTMKTQRERIDELEDEQKVTTSKMTKSEAVILELNERINAMKMERERMEHSLTEELESERKRRSETENVMNSLKERIETMESVETGQSVQSEKVEFDEFESEKQKVMERENVMAMELEEERNKRMESERLVIELRERLNALESVAESVGDSKEDESDAVEQRMKGLWVSVVWGCVVMCHDAT